MAKQKLNLHDYQQEILAKLKLSTESGQVVSGTRLAVKAGKFDFLFALADVREVLAMPDVLGIPHTQPWFLGMANVRGNLYAVSDLAQFLGEPPSIINSQSRLLLLHDRFGINSALLVSQLIGLRSLDDMQVQKKTRADAKSPWILNRFKDANDQKWEEVDISKLVNQHEFIQVAA